MNFTEIAQNRQSCRSYDAARAVEEEKIAAILESARLSPSACNGQPYFITVCKGEAAQTVAKATQGMGMNKFASDAPIQIVISEMPYVKTAAFGAKVKGNDYRSIDIGIAAAYEYGKQFRITERTRPLGKQFFPGTVLNGPLVYVELICHTLFIE